jgi:4-hydroxy-tetrahydrodipicolinate synthase
MEDVNLSSLYTAMVTPFNADRSVNYDSFARNVNGQLNAGVDGLLFLGTTAETPTLSSEEQAEILRVGMEEVAANSDHPVSVMVGTGTNCTATTIENTQKAAEMGANIALVVAPYYNKPQQSGLYHHFATVAENGGLPVVVYNVPGRASVNIEPETIERLADLPNIVGVKEASGNISQMADVLYRTQEKDFSFFSGDDALTLPVLAMGGQGVISVLSNFDPRGMLRLVDAGLSGDFDTAREVHDHLYPLMQAAFCETNPAPIKHMMEHLGLDIGPCRPPISELSEANRAQVNLAIRNYLAR